MLGRAQTTTTLPVHTTYRSDLNIHQDTIMHAASESINIKVILGDDEHNLITYHGEYRSLMMLLSDQLYIEDFGECRGVGRCGTCLIEIIEGGLSLHSYGRNEKTTIMRLGQDTAKCRLSCQISIGKDLNDIKIKVKQPEQ